MYRNVLHWNAIALGQWMSVIRTRALYWIALDYFALIFNNCNISVLHWIYRNALHWNAIALAQWVSMIRTGALYWIALDCFAVILIAIYQYCIECIEMHCIGAVDERDQDWSIVILGSEGGELPSGPHNIWSIIMVAMMMMRMRMMMMRMMSKLMRMMVIVMTTMFMMLMIMVLMIFLGSEVVFAILHTEMWSQSIKC